MDNDRMDLGSAPKPEKSIDMAKDATMAFPSSDVRCLNGQRGALAS
jgi:hypothetical protein